MVAIRDFVMKGASFLNKKIAMLLQFKLCETERSFFWGGCRVYLLSFEAVRKNTSLQSTNSFVIFEHGCYVTWCTFSEVPLHLSLDKGKYPKDIRGTIISRNRKSFEYIYSE